MQVFGLRVRFLATVTYKRLSAPSPSVPPLRGGNHLVSGCRPLGVGLFGWACTRAFAGWCVEERPPGALCIEAQGILDDQCHPIVSSLQTVGRTRQGHSVFTLHPCHPPMLIIVAEERRASVLRHA